MFIMRTMVDELPHHINMPRLDAYATVWLWMGYFGLQNKTPTKVGVSYKLSA